MLEGEIWGKLPKSKGHGWLVEERSKTDSLTTYISSVLPMKSFFWYLRFHSYRIMHFYKYSYKFDASAA